MGEGEGELVKEQEARETDVRWKGQIFRTER